MYTYEIYSGEELLAVQSNYRKAADFARQLLISGFPVTFNRCLKRIPDQIIYSDVNATVSYLRKNRFATYSFFYPKFD